MVVTDVIYNHSCIFYYAHFTYRPAALFSISLILYLFSSIFRQGMFSDHRPDFSGCNMNSWQIITNLVNSNVVQIFSNTFSLATDARFAHFHGLTTRASTASLSHNID